MKAAENRLPSLDGWRAFSIMMVLGSHTQRVYGYPSGLDVVFKWLDGDLGVRCFFVISGFLITWLMVSEVHQTGKVNLSHFYMRRALRILPIYFAFLCTLGLLSYLTPFHQPLIVWFGNLTFTTNFVPATWTSGHLWSLSVEEQFYLIWPLAFMACKWGGQVRKMYGSGLLSCFILFSILSFLNLEVDLVLVEVFDLR